MIYLQILRFSFLRFFAYPYEIVAEVLRSLIVMLFLIFFWSVVAKSMDQQNQIIPLVSYFLIATGVKDLVMADYGIFGGELGDLIKSGKISNYLLKPTNVVFSAYTFSLGKVGVPSLISLINIFLGLWISPPVSFISIILFLVFLLIAVAIGFSLNLMIGVIYFHTPDASGIRNTLNHIVQVLSGAMVPLYLFPENWRNIVEMTPFPALVFGPVNALKSAEISSLVVGEIFQALFWGVFLNLAVYYFWQRASKKYEATGI